MKWADYLISGISYNKGDEFITHVVIRKDNDDSVGVPSILARQEVINYIKKGYTFMTTYKEKDGTKWNKGANVEIIQINDKEYIRTDKNKTQKDNLENLPEI